MKYAFEESPLYQVSCQFIEALKNQDIVLSHTETRFNEDNKPYVSTNILFTNPKYAVCVLNMMERYGEIWPHLSGEALNYLVFPNAPEKNPLFSTYNQEMAVEINKLINRLKDLPKVLKKLSTLKKTLPFFEKALQVLDPNIKIIATSFKEPNYDADENPYNFLTMRFSAKSHALSMIGFLLESGDKAFTYDAQKNEVGYIYRLNNPSENLVFDDFLNMSEIEWIEAWKEKELLLETGRNSITRTKKPDLKTAEEHTETDAKEYTISFWKDHPEALQSSLLYPITLGCNLDNFYALISDFEILKDIHTRAAIKKFEEMNHKKWALVSSIAITIEVINAQYAKALYDTMRQFEHLFNRKLLKLNPETHEITYCCKIHEDNFFYQTTPDQKTIDDFSAALLENHKKCAVAISPTSITGITDIPATMFAGIASSNAQAQYLDHSLSW